MSKYNTSKTRGTMQAIGVALHQGYEGVLVTLVLLFVTALGGTGDKAAFSGAVLGVKEIIALVLALGWTLIRKGPSFFKNLAIKLKTRQGLWFILAGIIGTSLGNLFYILGVVFAGSGYGVILTALYPVFSMLLVKFIQKEKEPIMVWIGVAIAVFGGFLTLLLPVLINGDEFSTMKLVGMIFGLLAAIFWAFEGLFINMGLKAKKNYDFSNGEIIITRSIFTTITTIAVLMPILMAEGSPFVHFNSLFTNWQAILVVIAISVNIIILRALHVGAIRNVGPKVTAIIDTNNFIVPAIVAQIFICIPALADTFSDSTIDWWAYILLIPIVVGVFMVIHFHQEEEDKLPLDVVNWQSIEESNKLNQ